MIACTHHTLQTPLTTHFRHEMPNMGYSTAKWSGKIQTCRQHRLGRNRLSDAKFDNGAFHTSTFDRLLCYMIKDTR